MITVTSDFTTKSNSNLRKPQYKIELDWNLSGTYQDETDYILVIEVERGINEPLGGIALAQSDLRFTNYTGRYTPPDTTD